MDKKCLLTFFSVPLIFKTNYTPTTYAFTLYLLGEQTKKAHLWRDFLTFQRCAMI